MTKISLEKPATGRFVQYRCINVYMDFCGLQYIGVLDSTNLAATTITTSPTATTSATSSGLFHEAYVVSLSHYLD